MDAADVVIAWDFAPIPLGIRNQFQRPTRFITLPTPQNQKYGTQIQSLGATPVHALIQSKFQNFRPLRIATLGFSESCQGPRALLASGDGSRIDTVMCFDGIHTQYVPEKVRSGNLEPSRLAPYAAFGKLAVADGRILLITTSSIVPPDFVSTTDTADWIWQKATGSNALQATEAPPNGVWDHIEDPPYVASGGCFKGTNNCWPKVTYTKAATLHYRRSGGLTIYNYANLDPTGHNDHVYQAVRVLPLMTQAYLIERWNRMDPSSGVCLLPA